MGHKASKEDVVPLLEDEGVCTKAQMFNELKLVLIGSRGAGKNTIANAILGENIFTPLKVFKHTHTEVIRTVSGRRIRLSRTKGWRGELKSRRTKQAIVHCVQTLYDTGPHAVLLVLNVDSVLSESTMSTLEDLLTVQLWQHTIVVFTQVEKLRGYSIKDYIRCQQLQPLIDTCGGRHLEIGKNGSNQIVETIEELIASKNSTSFFKMLNQKEADQNTLLNDWDKIVKRGKSKINFLSICKNKLNDKLKHNTKNKHNITAEIKAKDAEIERLKTIVKEKEREIARLRSSIGDRSDLSPLLRKITELEHQVKVKNYEIEKKEVEIVVLKMELQMWRENSMKCRTPEDQRTAVHSYYCSELSQDVSVRFKIHNHTQLQEFPAKAGSALETWSETLLEILKELPDDELKKMKYYICSSTEFRIPQSSLESKDRVDLAKLMLKQWGEQQSILITQELMKKIPRNDDKMIELFTPFLKGLGETW